MPHPIKPKKLERQATIGIVAPASPMKIEKLDEGIRYLENLGFRIELGKEIYSRRGYLAGTDEARAKDLNQMFARKDIDAIFCVRGGYGSPRILSLIDYSLIRSNPKIFVGYSDITALQLAIYKFAGLVTFSGPMVAVEFAQGIHPQTEEKFWQLLTDANQAIELAPLVNPFIAGMSRGKAEGPLLGGCLSLIAAVVGTEFFPDFADAILFLEDVGEEPYRIDGYLAHLKNAGVLAKIAGIIAGKFKDCNPEGENPSLTLDEVLQDYFAPLNVPVIRNFDYGHGKVKYTLPVGIRVGVHGHPAKIEFLEPAVCQ